MRTITIFTVALCALAAVACSTRPKTSGFLGDYSAMKPIPGIRGALREAPADDEHLDYDQLLFDAAAVQLHPGAKAADVDEETLHRVGDAFITACAETVEPYYDVVAGPGEGVLRVRVAITDATFAGAPSPDSVTSLTIEAELVDSLSGERVAAVVRRRSESGLDADESDGWPYGVWAESLLDFMNDHH